MPINDNFSPVVSEAYLSGTDAWAQFPVPSCEYVRLYPISGTVRIFFNAQTNTKAFTLREPMSVPNVDGQMDTIWVYFSGAGEIDIKAMTTPPGITLRA